MKNPVDPVAIAPAHYEAYQACLHQAMAQGPVLMGRWAARLLDVLMQRLSAAGSNSERQFFVQAIEQINQSKEWLAQTFVQELDHAIAEDESGSAQSLPALDRSLFALRFDQLELMGDGQVQDLVNLARLQQVAQAVCKNELAIFNGLMSTVRGYVSVRMDKNPLRPEVVARALLKLLQAIAAPPQVRAHWCLNGAQLLGEELRGLYAGLTQLLASAGVVPASPDHLDAFAVPAQKQGDLLTLDHLHHLLVGDYDHAAGTDEPETISPLDPLEDFPDTAPSQLGTSGSFDQPDLTQLGALNTQLKTQASNISQSLAVEVVGLIVRQISSDSRLLEPVRNAIASMEPALLRLALSDPRFFSSKTHPARRLLETITEKSLAYLTPDAPGFVGFMQDLNRVLAVLASNEQVDAQHFMRLLAAFEQKQGRKAVKNQQAQGQAVKALLAAEQRNVLAARISEEIKARPDYLPGNRVITSFLIGPWAQVMAQERLSGEQTTPGEQSLFGQTLTDLLWSINVELASRHRKRLSRTIPGLLNGLREGLLSIDYPLERSKPFFEVIMTLHQLALQPPGSAPSVARAKSNPGPATNYETKIDSDEPWLAPTEVVQSGFMEDVSGHTDPRFAPTAPLADEDDIPLPGQLLRLPVGAWVQWEHKGTPLRAQLTWVSPHNMLLMFVGAGGRAYSMTQRALQKMHQKGVLKIINQEGMVESALDMVVRAAMRNSVEGGGQ